MGNPYTSQSISGYNSSPPPDDGTTTSANQLNWSKHKTKLSDPIKTLAEAIDTAAVAAFAKIFGSDVSSTAANYTVQAGDQGKLIRATAAVTITTPAAATEGAPFCFAVHNAHTASITVAGNGSETIDGVASVPLGPGMTVIIMTDGTNWFSMNNFGNTSLSIESTDATATVGPTLDLYRNSASPADDDDLGNVTFGGENDNDEKITYAEIRADIIDASDGTEDGALRFRNIRAGVEADRMELRGGLFMAGATGGDQGTGSFNASAIYDDGVQITAVSAISDISTLESPTTTTSATSFDYTGIAAGARRITVMFNNVSLDGTDDLLIQLGDSGGIETTGYVSYADATTNTTGFVLQLGAAGQGATGQLILTLMDSSTNTWTASGGYHNNSTTARVAAGVKALSATLTQLRLTRTGTDTFDGGSFNILIE